MKPARLLCAGLALVCAAGCAADARDAGLDRLEAEPTLRVGDGDLALTRILAVAVDARGRTYLAQWQDGSVRVLGADGTPAGQVGRAGQGPGEFRQPGALGFRGDSLWVVDDASGRLALFDPEHRLVRQVAFRRALGERGCNYRPGGLLSDGRLAATVGCFSRLLVGGEIDRLPVLVTNDSGGVLDTLITHPPRADLTGVSYARAQIYTMVPELAGPPYALHPSGEGLVALSVADADGAPVLVAAWIGAAGDTAALQRHAFAPVVFEEELRERVLTRLTSGLTSMPGFDEQEFRQAAREQIPWPAHRPPYTEALVGTDGRLWLRRDAAGDSVRWETWTPGDGPSAELWLPETVSLRYADAETLWAVEKDALDVERLVRYALRRRADR